MNDHMERRLPACQGADWKSALLNAGRMPALRTLLGGAIFLLCYLLFLFGCKDKSGPPDIKQLLSHSSLGLAYLEENRLAEAETEFKQLIELAPNEALGYANLALTYLRMDRLREAEQQVAKAIKLSQEPESRLIMAEILDRSGKRELAVTLLSESVQRTPDYVPAQYKLMQLHSRSGTGDRWKKMQSVLEQIIVSAPANLPARLQFAEVLIRNRQIPQAVVQLREIRQFFADLPADSESYFDRTLNTLQTSNTVDALPAAIAFHNLLKPVPLYQAGVMELSGPGGAMIGFPVQHFSSAITSQIQSSPLAHLSFVNDTSLTALATTVAQGDFDEDGDPDLFLAGENKLLRNEKGKYQSVAFPNTSATRFATFADYNNDGKLDLCAAGDTGLSLYRNNGGGSFKLIQTLPGPFNAVLFVDLDNEGDLDLYTIGSAAAFQNNGDDTFTDVTAKMGLSRTGTSTDALLSDFDDDGDIDLYVADPVSGDALYSNLRQGRFQDVTSSAGISGAKSQAVSSADYDRDGVPELFLTGKTSILFRNAGQGKLQKDNRLAFPANSSGRDAIFFDFDNDGLQDLCVAGETTSLYRNNGPAFVDARSVLPAIRNANQLLTLDYDSDGDLDLLTVDSSRKVSLLKNEGGNANRWLTVTLIGLGTGSGKNNRNGIGAKLEIKAGDLYQMRFVTEPVSHFGLGQRTAADVMRVVWTNGVPQNHFLPQSNQILLEKQVLKGSCAFLYTWDGEKYTFVTDIMWKSALGMPLGIMGGETAYAFPDSSDEFLKIPGDMLKEKDGFYSIQVTEELWETPYLDKMRLIAVDHPDTTEIYVDEKFVVPPFPSLKIYPVTERKLPLSAVDESGIDLLSAIREQDGIYVSNLKPAKYQGIMKQHEVVLDLGKFSDADDIVLFLNGWLYPNDASINVAVSQSNAVKVASPYLQVRDDRGKWQTIIPAMSFPMGKQKTMIVDVSGKFLTPDHHVRIRTSMEIYWDQIFFTKNEPSIPSRITSIKPASGDLHYRGFSRMYRWNVLGPHWFDYAAVDTRPQWRDLEGLYTRYGDVTPLLLESDDQYVIFNAGDEITIRFDARKVPSLPRRWVRDFLIYSDGWIKDGDLNTAHSKTVEPLPFHAMSAYPYPSREHYPKDKLHQDYLRAYNTRRVP